MRHTEAHRGIQTHKRTHTIPAQPPTHPSTRRRKRQGENRKKGTGIRRRCRFAPPAWSRLAVEKWQDADVPCSGRAPSEGGMKMRLRMRRRMRMRTDKGTQRHTEAHKCTQRHTDAHRGTCREAHRGT